MKFGDERVTYFVNEDRVNFVEVRRSSVGSTVRIAFVGGEDLEYEADEAEALMIAQRLVPGRTQGGKLTGSQPFST